jgi:oligopeptidase B
VEWASDSQTLFHASLDHANRASAVRRHRIGASASAQHRPAEAAPLLEEINVSFSFRLQKTRSGAFIVFESHSGRSSELHVLAADAPQAAPRLLRRRAQEVSAGSIRC